ncbi:LacI family DNA-binding transcriptional regulator [Rhizobium sp. LC145]|jgi:LacI family transcriptional regulator|uniref:LacI family DNA-binding transcriptional regulator n=1 Tax=Rhizobium sp. LC145 TaxID=1120688 RepID=UPI00062A0F3E|nr:LacI family DNA-binding transcriptional regulator [Rhizobium sp. LC145]KKX27123.1 LacI family transcriptional regulator [Rhizobium sp. LC145]TKT56560.1 LacI family transcriptional regulator [Rhizobiaceae bacterium LC148]
MTKVTLEIIARHTGLSKFAVSRSLSGKDGVSAETRRRVEAAALELGYRRSRSADPQSEIGIVFHDVDIINSELRHMIQDGVQREAHRTGRQIRLQWTHDVERVAEMAETSAGLILVGPHEKATLDIVRASGVPAVRMGWVDPLEAADHVGGTDHEAGAAVGDYLIGLGHRSIAFIHGMPGYRGRLERYYGLRERVEAHGGIELNQMWFDENDGFVPALRDLQAKGATPTALFCAHDGLALTAVSALLALGYRIPEDMSVVGFGDFSAATQIAPNLTTVKVHGVEMGEVALRLLIERINAESESLLPARRVLLASTFVERRSSGPAPSKPKLL